MRRRLGWIRTGLLAAAVVTAVAFQVASAPAAVGVFSLDRLRVENAGGAEDYVYTAGKVIFPEGGADTGSYYRFVVTDAAGTTRNSPVCRPASEFPTANNAYTVATTDPSSTATAWRYTLNQYVGSSCTGTPAKTAFKSFYVAKATTFSDAGLTTLRNAFHVGETAYVVLSGVKPSSDRWAVTWFLPSGALACANTAGTDRPDSRANGTLPKTAGTFLQFRPNTTSSGSAWNRESNYETRPCPTFAAGTQGAWTVRVQFDATNVVTLPAFVVDTTPPPTPTIDARPADPTNATSATFAFSDSEPGASFLCQRDGAAFASCSSPLTYTALAPGTHTFAVKARDAAGNEGGVSSFTWTIDTAAPAAPSIDSHPPTLSNSASASFTFSGESGASFLCQLDGSSFAACTSPENYSGLAEGAHAFAVKARNAAGNESVASSFTWSVDLTAPPAPSIDSHPPDPSNSASASFTFSDGEGGVSFRCALDSGGFAPCSSPASYSNLSETQHSFAVKALDAAGNESAPSSYTWFVSIAPIVTLASPTNGSSTSDATPTFAGQAGTQFGDSQVVTVNVYAGTTPTGPPVESLAAVVDPFGAYSADASPALTDDSYTARAEQSDAGGSTGFSTANTFVVDTTAPAVPTINTHPADPSNSASASFGFSGETGATFLCQLDGSGFSACTSPKSYSGLGEGAHSFGVKARDAAGNESPPASFSWTVDTIAPAAPTIDSHPTDPSNSASATFGFSGEAGANFLCQLDGGGFSACTSPKTYSGLDQGEHTFDVRARDAAGNESIAASFSWTVDTAGPAAPSIDSHPADPSNSASASLGFSGETGATFLCQLDGGGFSACTSPKSYSGLGESAHSFQVKARDAGGNESTPASFSWTIDMTAPAAPAIGSHPADPSNSASASFGFSGETGVTFLCQLDGSGFSACTSPKSYPGLADGAHSFGVKARDEAGNESTPASFSWTVDTIAPAAPTIGSHPADPTNAASASLGFTAEAGASFLCRLDGGGFSACTSPKSYSGLGEGAHGFGVKARDAAGNESTVTSFSWTVDATAPAITLASPANSSTTSDSTPTFSGTAGSLPGDSTTVTVRVYQGSNANGTPIEILITNVQSGSFAVDASPALADGTYTAKAEQGDAAGNLGVSSANTFVVDTTIQDPTPPVVTLTQPIDGSSTNDTTPTFVGVAGTAPGDLATVTVKVYVGSTPTGSPVQTLLTFRDGFGNYTVDATALAQSLYTAQAEQQDVAGNLGRSTPASFTVDTTPPAAPAIGSHPADPSNSASANFSFTGEAGASFLCQLDGGGFSTCTSPKSYSGLAQSAHSFQVKARDAAGNESTVTTFGWTIDTTAPAAPAIGSRPADPSNSASASFDFTGETGATFLCQLDGGGFSACTSPKSYSGLSEGAHSFGVKARDAAGNESTPASFSWTVDTIAPAAPTIDSHPTDPTNAASATFGFSGEAGANFLCQLDGGGFSACTSPKSYSGLGEGAHSFGVKARDAAGNESVATSFSWTIDTVPPSAPSIDSHPPVATTSSAASFTFSGGSGASFLCQLDGSGFSACTSPKNYSGLAEGAHSFQVKARDVAGNESTPASFSWTIDTTLPIITLTSPADGSSSSNANPTFSGVAGTASGDSAGVVVEVYPGSVITGTPVRTLNATAQPNGVYTVTAGSALNEGTYTARAEQQDAAGNLGMSTANTFVIGTSYRDEVSADGPRSYWRLDESSGTVAADQTGANGGTYVGGVTLAQAGALAGDTNTSASFDGVNDYVTALDSNSLDLTTAGGVEVWVKRTKSAAYQVIVGKPGNGQSKFENYALWLDTSNRVIGYFGDGVNFVSVVGPAIDTNWHHVVTTYDNATAKIYVDGTLRASTASTIRLTANALPLNIGRASSSAYYFGGRIDELAVYPSALSAQRVQAHYNAGIGADTRPPLVTLTSPANGSTTNDSTPTLTGLAGSAGGDSPTVTVKVYSGGSPIGTPVRTLTATRQPDTSYAVDLSPQLADGTYTARAEQTDAAGNIGLSSANTFTVAGTAPVVTLTTPADGTSTSNRTPTFSGTAGTGPGDSPTVFVKIYPGSTPTGTPVQTLTTTRDSAGPYSVAAAAPLADGTYTAQAEQTGLDGSVGRSSAPTSRIDNIAPAVVLTAPANGSTTGRTTPSFSGTAGTALGDLASVTVKLYAGPDTTGTLLQTLTAAVGEGGAYSVPASSPLTPGIYTARTDQSDGAGNLGQSSANTFTVTADAPVLLAAGDIADCPPTGAQATAAILDANPDAIVAALGDTAYNNGQPSEYTNCYDPSWGRAKARTRPMIGDHEYGVVSGGTPPGVGFVNYFHDQLAPFGPNALDPAKLYYSYDLGAWHIVVLNVQCYEGVAPGCNPGLQEQWFENDLAANPTDCTVVMWHKPRFSSGSIHGDYFPSQQFWETSYDHGVELVFSGDDHLYERFARMDAVGNADPQYGVRQFVLGMGGYSHYSFSTIQPNSQVRNSDAYGLLKLTLHPASYDWQFLPEAGKTFTDSGSETCHAPPPAPPAGAPTVRAVSSSIANHPSSSLTIAKPAGTTQGDVLLAFGGHQSGSATNLAAPAGWTAVPNTDYSDANNARIHAWYKIAGAIEPASYTFTLSGGGQAIAGGMMAITGATATPINASLGQVNGTNSIFLTAPSITTIAAKTLLVYGGAVNAPVSITPPGFMHEQFDVATSGAFNLTIGAATQVIASAGSTDVRTAYLSSAAHGPAFLIAIAPSAP